MPDPTESSSPSPESAPDASTDAAEPLEGEESSGTDTASAQGTDAEPESAQASQRASQQGPEQPSLTDAFSEAAQEVLEKRLRWVGVLRKAVQRLGEDDSVPAVLARDIATLFRMVRAWRNGTYAYFPWRSIGVITLAVLYFVIIGRSSGGRSLAGLGIIDDTAILAFVVRTTHSELERFRSWEDEDTETDAEEMPSNDEA